MSATVTGSCRTGASRPAPSGAALAPFLAPANAGVGCSAFSRSDRRSAPAPGAVHCVFRYTCVIVSSLTALGKGGLQRLGRYQLLGRLAQGGMGEIYLARSTGVQGFEKLVVIKAMLPRFFHNEKFEELFFNEARISALLSHPNVCQVFELDREGDFYFMAMEYLQGIDAATILASHAKRGVRLDVGLVTAMIQQACDGLHHAHELRDARNRELGLVHRDVSPANLFVTGDGIIKLLDFGVAKLHASAPQQEVSQVKGKFAYMSPEQLQGERLDRRADVFSLGVVCWEMLTGRRLFRKKTDALTVKAVLEDPIPRLDEVLPEVPSGLADVVAKAMDRDIPERYASAHDLGAAIAEAVTAWHPRKVGQWVQTTYATELDCQRRLRVRMTSSQFSVVDVEALEELSVTELTEQLPVVGPVVVELGTEATAAAQPPVPRSETELAQWPTKGGRRLVLPLVALLLAGAGGSALLWTQCRGAGSSELTSSQTAAPHGTPVSAPLVAPPDAAAVRSAPLDAGAPVPVDAAAAATVAPVRKTPTRPTKSPRELGEGTLSIDATPYATVYVRRRGAKRWRKLGDTPLLGVRLSSGSYQVRADGPDGRSKTMRIRIRKDKRTLEKVRW